MPKVLIVTYYWPPSGGSAVLRWLKFAKYLPEFGWQPVIYTPSNPEPQEVDESLLADINEGVTVIRKKIIEPYAIYKLLTGKKRNERLGVALMESGRKSNIMDKVSLWIRSNLFIPDPRVLWVNPSVRFLLEYLDSNPVDVIITTGPPHSMHLIGLKLKKKTGIKWVADFRDPWTKIDFYNQLTITALADKRHRKLEKQVLLSADHIITVSPGMTEDFRAVGVSEISTITNGYDDHPDLGPRPPDSDFSFVHLGSMPKSRNPQILWEVLKEIGESSNDFKNALRVRLIGKIDVEVSEAINESGLNEFVHLESYIPHSEAQKVLASSSVLMLVINNTDNARGILTNKFFEYLAAKRPIVAIGPTDGDAAIILKESGAGEMFEYNNKEGLKNYIAGLFDLYSHNLLNVKTSNIGKYSRKNLTARLAGLLTDLIK